jgi:hypothetical protein
VVVPAAMRLVWAEELERWLPGVLRPAHLHIVESKADRLQVTRHRRGSTPCYNN